MDITKDIVDLYDKNAAAIFSIPSTFTQPVTARRQLQGPLEALK
jgi:hypothetical protein